MLSDLQLCPLSALLLSPDVHTFYIFAARALHGTQPLKSIIRPKTSVQYNFIPQCSASGLQGDKRFQREEVSPCNLNGTLGTRIIVLARINSIQANHPKCDPKWSPLCLCQSVPAQESATPTRARELDN